MLIKVCGMRDADNIEQVRRLKPDMMGLIFYARSSRFVGTEPLPHLTASFAPALKVGVFVNETVAAVADIAVRFRLNAVQLHGNESPAECAALRQTGLKVIKAFGISSAADFAQCASYSDCCDLFLFDTRTAGYGGAGVKFDWSILAKYKQDTPFLLSGGISADDAADIRSISHPQLAGIDLNSRFETAPALKDVAKLRRFIADLTTENT
jgi:phosphoribosylanthranilate isomerase